MKRIALVLALMLPAPAAFAWGAPPVPATVEAQIRSLLTQQGYEVRRIQVEDGLYEAYVVRDGHRAEVYLDSNLAIVRGAPQD